MKANVSLVLDLFSKNLSKSDWRKIVQECCRILLHENKEYGLRHLFIEEAADFVPQRIQPGQGECYSAVEQLHRVGGNSSVGCTLINPRAEGVNKEVLENCECMIVLRQKGKNSLTSLGRWVDQSDPTASKEIVRSLKSLQAGQCWVWPTDDEPVLCQFPWKNSFHPDRRNPTDAFVGESVDVGSFVNELKSSLDQVIAEAQAKDPVLLQKRIRELERQLGNIKPSPPQIKEVPCFTKSDITALDNLLAGLKTFADGLKLGVAETGKLMESIVSKIPRASKAPVFAQSRPIRPEPQRSAPLVSEPVRKVLNTGMRRMMIALAQRPGLNKRQLGVRAGLKQSGTFNTYLSTMRSNGWLQNTYDGGMALTLEGTEALGSFEPLPEGKELYAYWLAKLGDSGAARMLTVLFDNYPDPILKTELAEAAGMTLSGTFNTYLSTLRSLDLVVGRVGNRSTGIGVGLTLSSELYD